MHRYIAGLLVLLAALVPGSARADLDVVATVTDLAAIAKEVGGKHATVTALSLPTQDPHWVDAKPSLTLQVNKADLLVAVGLDLEVGWLPVLQTGARNAKVQRGGRGFLECSQFVRPLEVPTGPVDRSMGDIHPGGNPHYLYDPRNAAACAKGIAAKMAALDPAHAAAYQANAERFAQQLETRRATWEKRMRSHRGDAVITYHRSWVYLTTWLGLNTVEYLEPKPGISPSPRHVVEVIRTGKQRGVDVLLQESYYPSKTGKLVAGKIGAKLVQLPGGTDFASGKSYLEHMDALVSQIASALGS